MRLAGQGSRAGQRGYAMAALLVGMNVMAVLMAVALPVWSHATRREREEELIWRGEQYRRAIMLFQRKFANTFPPTIDILVEQKFLRKKYKDPITNDEFQIIPVGAAQPIGAGLPGGSNAGPGRGGTGTNQMGNTAIGPGGTQAGSGFSATFTPNQSGTGWTGIVTTTPGSQPAMGIQGVTSKSKDTSIKRYNGMDRYNLWAFIYLAASTQAGGGGTGFARPGQTGGGFGQPPGPGQTPPFGQPGSGFGQPGSGFGQPAGGFGQPSRPPVPGGGFGQPGGMGPGGSVFTPGAPGSGGQARPPVGGGFGSGARPPER